MEIDYIKFTQKLLKAQTFYYNRNQFNIDKNLTISSSIKAVIFDVYGTMLFLCHPKGTNCTEKIILSSLQAANISFVKNIKYEYLTNTILSLYDLNIKKSQELIKSKNNIRYPEINILKIWENIISELSEKRMLIKQNNINIKKLAFVYETLTNPVYADNDLFKLLCKVKQSDIELGILSNAQFYTSSILNFHLYKGGKNPLNQRLFNKKLSIFSYEFMAAKPSFILFNTLKIRLAEYSILPQETLYVGNDILRDIAPAKKIGFKTALITGDKNSFVPNNLLRFSSKEHLKPDYIINTLDSILMILSRI